MGSLMHYVLSARFILSIGHLITILLVLATLKSNVNASLSDNASPQDVDDAMASSQVFYVYMTINSNINIIYALCRLH